MENIYPMNLQLFAEGEAAAEAEASGAAETKADESGEKMIPQSEVEKIINARFAKMKRDADKQAEQARKEGISEGEKLATMSAEERIKAQQEKAESDFKTREDAQKQREAELTRKELRAQAVETLTGKGLPASLADILTLTDAEACNASIATVEKAFRDAVKAEVDKRLAASAAPLSRSGSAEAEKPKGKDVEIAEKLGSRARESAKTYQSIIDKYK